jgi:hypothetical protein
VEVQPVNDLLRRVTGAEYRVKVDELNHFFHKVL